MTREEATDAIIRLRAGDRWDGDPALVRPDLNAIRMRVLEASEGPWAPDTTYDFTTQDGMCGCGPTVTSAGQARKDGEFIGHARTDIPALLVYIKALEATR